MANARDVISIYLSTFMYLENVSLTGPFPRINVPGRAGELGRRLLLFFVFGGGCPPVHPPLVLGARRLLAAHRLSDLL